MGDVGVAPIVKLPDLFIHACFTDRCREHLPAIGSYPIGLSVIYRSATLSPPATTVKIETTTGYCATTS